MTSIFVAKLDFGTTDEQLKSLFEQYGRVNRVTIAKDRETGKPRGFAFVEMFDEAQAEAAIDALDNSSVNGRQIAVKKADDRGSKPGGNAGGRPERSDRPQRPDGNRFENRPPRTDSPGFRPNSSTEERPPFKQTDDAPARSFEDKPFKTERKKEPKKDNVKKSLSDQPKQQKMEAYRKSGKNRFDIEDDDEDDDWAYQSRRSSGWDDEEE